MVDTEITVDKGFDKIMVDAKKYKDAKDLIERLTPSEYFWVITRIKFNKFFTSPLFKMKKILERFSLNLNVVKRCTSGVANMQAPGG